MKTFKTFLNESDEPITGVHFSHRKDMGSVSNAYSGTGIADARQKRLEYSPKDVKDKIGKTSFFYTGDKIVPESGLGPHRHEAKFDKKDIYGPHTPDDIKEKVNRDAEDENKDEHPLTRKELAIHKNGFHGYQGNGMLITWKKTVPVTYVGEEK